MMKRSGRRLILSLTSLLIVTLSLLIAGGCKEADNSFANAQKVTSRHQLVGGPHALGEVGDYLLENDEIRLVIQDKDFNRGNGLHGGSLIDADLRRSNSEGDVYGGNGKDSFGEFFPAWFLEVIDPRAIEIVQDGSDGEAAIIEVRGVGGEFVTMLRFINQILVNSYEPDLESILAGEPPESKGLPHARFKVRYILEPDSRHVRVEGTIINNTFETLGFPNTEVTNALKQFVDFDFSSLEVPTGHAIGFGAHNRLFVPGIGYDIRFGLEEIYNEGVNLPVLPGKPTDFLATTGKGDVNYGFAAVESDSNFITTLNEKTPDGEGYGPETDNNDSLVLFDAAGFTGVLTHAIPSELGPDICTAETAQEGCRRRHRDCREGCSDKVSACISSYVEKCGDTETDIQTRFTFANNFIVGDGNVSSILSEVYDIRGIDATEISGRVYDETSGQPIGEANLLVYQARENGQACEATDSASPTIYNQIHSNTEGYVDFELPPGDYCYRIRTAGRDLTPYRRFEVGDEPKHLRFQAEPTSHLKATVTNAGGMPMPAKLVVVGRHEAQPPGLSPRKFLFELEAGEPWRTTDMVQDVASEPSTRRYIERVVPTDSTGFARAKVRPGDYTVFIHRGPEYELEKRQIELEPNGTAHISTSLKHVVDTEGYLSGDYHLHAAGSIDSGVKYHARVSSLAANDLEVPVATDHNYHSDYLPYIYRWGYNEWLKSLIGVELTTFEFGHYNAFPLKYEIGSQNHGSIKWQNRRPNEIFESLRQQGAYGPENTIVQVNHPRDSILGYFSQFSLDGLTGKASLPTKGEEGVDQVIAAVSSPSGRPYVKQAEGDSEEITTTFSRNFDAVSILTGKRYDLIEHYRVPYEPKLGADQGGWPTDTMETVLIQDCENYQQENLQEHLDQKCSEEYPDRPREDCPITADDVERSEWCTFTEEDIFDRYPEGAILCNDGNVAYPGALNDWYNLLNTTADDGTYYRYTATGNSDTHNHAAPEQYDPGLTRNYFYVGRDNPEALKSMELVDAVQQNRNIVTTGPFALLEIDDADIGGQTISEDGTVEVTVTIRAADWVGADRFKLIGNGRPVEIDNDDSPTVYEFDLQNGEFKETFDVGLEGDSWFVLEVRGDNNMFPVYPPLEKPPVNFQSIFEQVAGPLGFGGGGREGLKPDQTRRMTPFAVTNPIWVVDARQTDGGSPLFTPPSPEMPSCDQPTVELGTYSAPNIGNSNDEQ
jgi:hypothetical protein